MIPDDVTAFLDRHIGSLWGLELVLLMRKHPSRTWTAAQLVAELRASERIVTIELPVLLAAELIMEVVPGTFRYAPSRPELETTMARLDQAYKEFPVSVVRHIALAPNRDLKEFADAFRFRKE